MPDRMGGLARLDAGDLRAFIDEAPVSMAMFDSDMRYLAASQRWIERLRVRTGDLIGRSHYDVNPEVPHHWREFHRRALAGETIREERERLQRPDGSPMWLRWQAWPWHDADGEIGGITIVSEDVTAEIEREQGPHQGTRALARLHDVGWRLRLASSLREGLDEMLSATIELLSGDMGHVHVLDPDGKTLRLVTHYGFAPEIPKALHAVSAADDTPPGRALHTRSPVVIADMETDDSYTAFRSVAREAGYRAVVEAPLIGRYGTPLGMISTHFRAPHSPSSDDLQRLELYRRRAADFIERFNADEALRESNARLAAETKATARFYEFGLKIVMAQNLREALDLMVLATNDMLGADMGIIRTLDSDGKSLHVASQQGFDREFVERLSDVAVADDGHYGDTLRTGYPMVVEDIETDQGYAPFRAIACKAGYRAVMSAPLVGRYGKPQGVISLYFRSPHRPNDTDLRRLEFHRRRGGDFIERFKAEDALRESEERVRLAVTSGRTGMFDWDLRTGMFAWTEECYRILGYSVGEIEPSQTSWIAHIHPEDRGVAETAETRAKLEHEEFRSEYRIIRRDGGVRWVLAHGRFLYDGDKPVRMIGLKRDITEARQQMETQRVLVGELQHRTRNLMAVVQSIARQTLDNAGSLADFEERFNHRLQALSRVQSLLSRAEDEPITVRSLVVMELEALGPDAFDERITFAGPDAPIRKSIVEMLSLAIHELLTNAIKYGALASPTGHLSVTWRIDGVRPSQRLVLEWTEHGVEYQPGAADPARRGYGRTLIEEALPYSLSAETRFELGAEGPRCLISLPLTTNETGP